MKRVLVVGLLLVGCVAVGRGEPMDLALVTGEVVEVDALVRRLPTALQVRLPDGSLRLIRAQELTAESLNVARQLVLAERRPMAAPKPERKERPLSIDFDVVNVGSMSSSKDRYYLYGVKVRTTTSGVTHELRMTLRNRPSVTVQVVSVIGGGKDVQDVDLVQSRAVPIRLEIGGKSRTVTSYTWRNDYSISKQPRDAWFVQVLLDGEVLHEAGELAGHEAGTPLVDVTTP